MNKRKKMRLENKLDSECCKSLFRRLQYMAIHLNVIEKDCFLLGYLWV